ncbi:hypothetical protein EX895_004822 [Sporisorium graminicola]|uniref:Man(5)GlcNAc(2)-PP-dolichol translocation protein RFT1 n=1 Tax=Sporisorium graminicola TaxID=280036 RepID=A0A4U7KQ35_9BASI|nr:hypothetical protein EX895_004822 [Sporisorium graminicola]TKY85997.1 hypothetical protein EX895_004822 [Sporisorium graminicola]
MASAHNGASGAAPASAFTLILLQVSARALTFVLNQLLVRLVSPSIFGLANIQLELLLSTILFLSRDGFRTILIRNEPVGSSSESTEDAGKPTGPRGGIPNSVHNITLMPIPIGFVLTVAACTAYVRYISPDAMHAVPTFHVSIALYALGALSELAYEPLLIRAVRLGHPALRVKAEGAAVFVKVISTIAAILVLPRWSTAPLLLQRYLVDERAVALLAFGLGQASFGLTMLAVHLSFFVKHYGVQDTFDLYIPRAEHITRTEITSKQKQTMTVWFDRTTLSLCATMSQQGILKHCLTEADKFAVARYATLEDQGGYALASNYGSLVARILFQPVEETSRIVFSSELTALDPDDAVSQLPATSKPVALERVGGMLSGLFRLHLLLACLLTTFGSPLSTAFLYIMAGPRWALETSAPAILAAYTFYLPIMGINGVVEGFVQSVASQRQVKRYSRVLLAASGVFVGALAGVNAGVGRSEAMRSLVGKTGLVWANAVSAAVRAGWCWLFLGSYFRLAAASADRNGVFDVSAVTLRAAVPSRPTLAAFALVSAVLRLVVPSLMPSHAELLLGSTGGRLQALRLLLPTLALAATCLGVVLGAIVLFERNALVRALRSLGRRGVQSGKDGETRKTQ